MDIERNVRQAAQDIENVLSTGTFYVDPDAAIQRVQAPKATKRDFFSYFSKPENFKVLFGTAYSWFALDVGSPAIIAWCSADIRRLDRFLWPWSEFIHRP